MEPQGSTQAPYTESLDPCSPAVVRCIGGRHVSTTNLPYPASQQLRLGSKLTRLKS